MKYKQNIITVVLALFMLTSLCACTNSEVTEMKNESNTSKVSTSQKILSTEPAQTSSEVASSTTQTISKITSSTQESSKTVSSKKVSNTQVSSPNTTRPKEPEKLSVDTEKKIKEDYVVWYNKIYTDLAIDVSNVTIARYLGTYSGGEVVCITLDNCAYTDCIIEKNIAGYDLYFPDGAPFYFHKNTDFYSLEDAYEKGFITKQDVRDVKWYLNDAKKLEQ